MSNHRVVRGCLAGLILSWALVGCSSRPGLGKDLPQPPVLETPTKQPSDVNAPCSPSPSPPLTRLEVDPKEYRRLFDTAIKVLRDNGFLLDRQDYRLGVITTRPLAAPTLFEPWNTTNKTAVSALESTLHDQRRMVKVQWIPLTDSLDSAYDLVLTVHLERRHAPSQRLEGSTHAQRLVGSLKPSLGLERPTSAPWINIGRDPDLERFLLERIVRQSLALTPP